MEKPHVTQSWALGEVKKTQKWKVVRLVFYENHEPIALCQILRKTLVGIPVVSRINRGPAFRVGLSEDKKWRILSEIRRRFRYFLGGILFIAPTISLQQSCVKTLRELGFIQRRGDRWHSSIIDLHLDQEEIRKRLKSKWRNQLNTSEKAEISLSISSSQEFPERLINKHDEHMRSGRFAGLNESALRIIQRGRPEDFVVLRASIKNELIAGIIILKHGLNAEYLVGWFGQESRKLNAGNFLLWNGLIEMKRRGCHWFDLGGFSISERYGHFKLGMGGDQYELIGEWLCFW